MTRAFVFVALTACVVSSALFVAAAVPAPVLGGDEALSGEELLSSFSQVAAALRTRADAQSGQMYHEVMTAEELVGKMRENIAADQKRDYDDASKVIAALEVDIQDLSATHASKSSIVATAESAATVAADKLATAAQALATANKALEAAKLQLSKTTRECADVKAEHLRTTAGHTSDTAEVAAVAKALASVECSEIDAFVQTLALPKSAAASLEMSSFLEVSQLPPESVDNGNDHGGLGSEYACDAKRQKVSSLLSTLRRQLAEASTATAAAFEKSMQACYADVTEQDARLKVVAADAAQAERDHKVLTTDSDSAAATLATAKADADHIASLLDAQNKLRTAERCQFMQRSTLRSDQQKLVNEVLSMLSELTKSPYATLHLNLTTHCPSGCNGHGVCLNSGCVCERGWSGLRCQTPRPASCPFTAPKVSPCANATCAGHDFIRMTRFSGCANTTCDYCANAGAFDPACKAAPVGLFCAEQERARGCGSKQCPETREACGPKRKVRYPFTGCCFSSVFDCVDACGDVRCPDADKPPACPVGLAPRHPYKSCCFDAAVDCVDECAVASCPTEEPVCPSGSTVRSPFAGCCFDPLVDCEDECIAVVCPLEFGLPSDACRARSQRWRGRNVGCCFDPEKDCTTGDDDGQANERRSLLTLYQAANGKHWPRQENWASDKWICFWEGVDCSGPAGAMRVTSLQLPTNDLAGAVPDEAFSGLQSLEKLDLSDNDLIGPLPPSIGDLPKLGELKVRGNGFSGQVPATVLASSSLVNVDLAWNFFTGSLASTLDTAPNATYVCTGNCACDECAPLRTAADAHNKGGYKCASQCN